MDTNNMGGVDITAATEGMTLEPCRIPVGLLFVRKEKDKIFRGVPAVGFPGTKAKTGLLIAKVGKRGNDNDWARSFVQYSPGWIENHRLSRTPSLQTTAMFWVKSGCGCENEEVILTPSEVFYSTKGVVSGKSAVDVLNRLTVCPVCHKGSLVDWRQLDPFDPVALAKFDDNDQNGLVVDGGLLGSERLRNLKDLVAKAESEPKEARAEFRIPGVVALSRCDWREEPEKLPDTEFYNKIRELAHSNHDDEGTPDPLRADLLNALDTKVAAILEDGVITPEEEAVLVEEAKAIGIDVEQFLAEVRERLPKTE